MKPARILYFIDGPMPTEADELAAFQMVANVVFRNAQEIPEKDHSLEQCDGVAGCVPKLYADAYPKAEDAIKAKLDSIKKLTDKVGDEPAPKVEKVAKQGAWKPNA